MTNPTAAPSPSPLRFQGNSVQLVGHYGGDATHALSAWTSTIHEMTEERRERVGPFLASLAQNGHHTPFEKSVLHFLCTTEIASHIHLLKHRIGVSLNSESARYKELRDNKFYVPEDWSVESQREIQSVLELCSRSYHRILAREEGRLGRKRAKESARFVLPYAMQYTVDVSFNFRSFMHFCGLRVSSHAQKEIKEVASRMVEQVALLPGRPFEHSIRAFAATSLREFPVERLLG